MEWQFVIQIVLLYHRMLLIHQHCLVCLQTLESVLHINSSSSGTVTVICWQF